MLIYVLRPPLEGEEIEARGEYARATTSRFALHRGAVAGLTVQFPQHALREKLRSVGTVEAVDESASQVLLSTGEMLAYVVVSGPAELTSAEKLAKVCKGYFPEAKVGPGRPAGSHRLGKRSEDLY